MEARSRLAARLHDGEQRVRAQLAIEERVPHVLRDHAPRRLFRVRVRVRVRVRLRVRVRVRVRPSVGVASSG